MPIRPILRGMYDPDWGDISHWVRFHRAGGKCEECSRPHGDPTYLLEDGRWLDPHWGVCWATRYSGRRWRKGEPAPWPDLLDFRVRKIQRLYLAAAHLDHDPRNNAPENLKALCPICHMDHDRGFHVRQIRQVVLLRRAVGDLFTGPYSLTLSVDRPPPPPVHPAVPPAGPPPAPPPAHFRVAPPPIPCDRQKSLGL